MYLKARLVLAKEDGGGAKDPPWTEEANERLMALFAQLGARWESIGERMGRKPVSCALQHRKLTQKMAEGVAGPTPVASRSGLKRKLPISPTKVKVEATSAISVEPDEDDQPEASADHRSTDSCLLTYGFRLRFFAALPIRNNHGHPGR